MLVAVELPDHLMISGAGGIEVGKEAEVIQSGFDSTLVVAPPADFRSRLYSHSEELKMAAQNIFRHFHNPGCIGCLFESMGNRSRIGEGKRYSRRDGGGGAEPKPQITSFLAEPELYFCRRSSLQTSGPKKTFLALGWARVNHRID